MSEPTRSEDDIDGNVWERESRAMLAYAQINQMKPGAVQWVRPDELAIDPMGGIKMTITSLKAERDRWKAEAERFTHLATQAETHRLEAERLRGEVARLTEKLFEVLTPRPDPVPVDPIHRALGVRGRPVIGLVTERV